MTASSEVDQEFLSVLEETFSNDIAGLFDDSSSSCIATDVDSELECWLSAIQWDKELSPHSAPAPSQSLSSRKVPKSSSRSNTKTKKRALSQALSQPAEPPEAKTAKTLTTSAVPCPGTLSSFHCPVPLQPLLLSSTTATTTPATVTPSPSSIAALPHTPSYVYLPMNDPRLKFVHQYAKAWNHCDVRFRQMMTEFCREDAVLLSRYSGPTPCVYGCEELHVQGRDAITAFFSTLMHSAPDLTFAFRAPRLQASHRDYTAIATTFTIVATKTLNMASDGNRVFIKSAPAQQPHMASKEGLLLYPLKEEIRTYTEDKQGPEQSETKEISDRLLLGVRGRALRFSIIGTFSYFLDSQGKVFKIEFRHGDSVELN